MWCRPSTRWTASPGPRHVRSAWRRPSTTRATASTAFAYRSIDYAGNVEPADNCQVRIDTTPPATTVSGATGRWCDKAVSLSFSASDKSSGVAFSEVKLDGGPWKKATTITISAPADHSDDGSHTISYRSIDQVGNVEHSQTRTVMIDTSAPRPVANWAATAARGKTASLRYLIADRRPGSPSATVTIRVRTLAGRLVRKLVERNVAVGHRSGCDLHLPPGKRSVSVLRLRHRRRRQPAERGRQQRPAGALRAESSPSARPLSSRPLVDPRASTLFGDREDGAGCSVRRSRRKRHRAPCAAGPRCQASRS